MRRFVLYLALGISTICLWSDLPAAERFSRTEIRVAYIYNFLKFVTWPAATFTDANAPYSLCVVGSEAKRYKSIFDKLTALTAKSRPIIVRYPTEILKNDCHIVFISENSRDRTNDILGKLDGSSTLTVSSLYSFTDMGGMIGFVSSGSKITFQINLDEAEQAGLKISANMLEVAQIVRPR